MLWTRDVDKPIIHVRSKNSDHFEKVIKERRPELLRFIDLSKNDVIKISAQEECLHAGCTFKSSFTSLEFNAEEKKLRCGSVSVGTIGGFLRFRREKISSHFLLTCAHVVFDKPDSIDFNKFSAAYQDRYDALLAPLSKEHEEEHDNTFAVTAEVLGLSIGLVQSAYTVNSTFQ